ncbi:hypothetical protein ASPCAL09493 [Aspergillus calidoustus]|uniref:DNA repair protein Dds20/Sfr1 n=1 Tax=Aspergillus calidoustus TaxID=454130 RepID=A0A0U5CRZ5_ASPCI|nr:hypothetical protein ASPCAL09493 [Aspergillus calidoustus]
MSSQTASAKRRRLDKASAALSRPFKSPLRRDTPTVIKEEAASPEKGQSIASNPSTQTTPSLEKTPQNPPHTPTTTNTLATPPLTARKRTIYGQHTAALRKPVSTDPEIQGLQKEQRTLQSRLATLRSELDTVQQALRIESSSRDEELEALIAKWKKVSQDAAEEVFTGAQERISRMGGVQGWREKMRSTDNRWEQEEMESWFGNVNAEALDFDADEVEARRAEMREEAEKKAREEQKKREAEANESEEFTMDMMLKTLNIDFKLIGYDKADQRWIKG